MGAIANEAVSPGSTRASRWPPKPLPAPPTGTRCRWTAKTSMSTIPNQKAGSASPTTETARTRWSAQPFWREAAKAANGTVMITAKTVATATREAVSPMWEPMSEETDTP